MRNSVTTNSYRVEKSIDKKQYIVAVYLDFKLAFETINKKTLINKLEYYGVNGKALNWLDSYLDQRSQRTKICDVMSDRIINEIGVVGKCFGAIAVHCLYE